MVYGSFACFLITAIAFFVFAVKYGLGQRPQPHHREAARRAGLADGIEANALFRGLYCPLAAAWAGLGILLVYVALTAIPTRDIPLLLVMTSAVEAAGITAAVVAYRFESDTGIRAPWRPAAAIVPLPLIGFVLALMA